MALWLGLNVHCFLWPGNLFTVCKSFFLHFGLEADIGTDTVNLVECYNYSNFRVHADYPQVV